MARRGSASDKKCSWPSPRPGCVRVGFWSPVLSAFGGTESWHQLLMSGLVNTTDPIDVIGMAVLDAPNDSAAVLPCPVQYGADALRSLACAVDVLIVWGIAFPSNYLPVGQSRPRVISVIHGDATHRWTRSVNDAAANDVDLFVAVSQAAKAATPAGKQSIVIENGISGEFFLSGRSIPRRGGPLRLAFIGRLSEEKRPLEFVELVAEIASRFPATASIYGDGRLRPAVEALARDLNVPITPFGAVGDSTALASELRGCDVLVSLSDCEGDGLARKQALACGVPVATTPTGSALEWPASVSFIPVIGSGRWMKGAVAAVLRAADRDPDQRIMDAMLMAELYSPTRFHLAWKDLILKNL